MSNFDSGKSRDRALYVKLTDVASWSAYKQQTRVVAYKHKALDIISGKEPEPSGDCRSEDPESKADALDVREDWIRRSDLMFDFFGLTIAHSNDSLIRDLEMGDAVGYWQAIMKHFESNTSAAIKQRIQSLVTLKQGDSSVLHFVDKIKTDSQIIRQAIEDGGLDLIDIMKSTTLISGLNSRFDHIKEALLLNDDMDFNQCATKVIEKAERLAISDSANGRSRSGKSGYNSNSENTLAASTTINCEHCDKPGHSADKCYTKYPHLRPKTGGGKPSGKPRVQKVDVKGAKSASVDDREVNAWAIGTEKSFTEQSDVNLPTNSIVFKVDSACEATFVRSNTPLRNFDTEKVVKAQSANGSMTKSLGCGTLNTAELGVLSEVYHDPKFCADLLSVANLVDKDIAVIFDSKGVKLVNAKTINVAEDKIIVRGPRVGGSFEVTLTPPVKDNPVKDKVSVGKPAYAAGLTARRFLTTKGGLSPSSTKSIHTRQVYSISSVDIEELALMEHLSLGCPCAARHLEMMNHCTGSVVPNHLHSLSFFTNIEHISF